MVFVHLSEEQRQELRQASRRAVGRVALRAQMVLLSHRGLSVPEIAHIHDCGCDVVRIWRSGSVWTWPASTVRRYLKAMDWRWARPRLAPASVLRRKRDPETEQKLAAIAAAAVSVAQGVGHLINLDECDLHLLPVVRAMWMKGPRVLVPTPGTNAKRAFFGALGAASGAFHWADHDRKLAVHFVAFLLRPGYAPVCRRPVR